MANKICIYALLPGIPHQWFTHTHTQGLSCPEKRGEKTRTLGRKGCLEMLARRRSQKAADAWNSVRATRDGGCPQPRGPRGYHRSGCHGNGAMWGRIPFSSLRWLKYPLRSGGGLNNKRERQQIDETSRIFKPCKMLVFFCIPSSPRLPSQVRARGFQIWQESRQQILLKCKLPQFHWSQQRYDNLHPLRFCHWVISTLQITGNRFPNKNTLKLEARMFKLKKKKTTTSLVFAGLRKLAGFSAGFCYYITG